MRNPARNIPLGLDFPKELYIAEKLLSVIVSLGFSFPFARLTAAARIVSHGSRKDTRCFRRVDLWCALLSNGPDGF
jgi:hypothetical protein